MKKRLTSYGWAWFTDKGQQVAAQVGHEWNGEILTNTDKRILRRIKK